MPRTVPSQVVGFIDRMFPQMASQSPDGASIRIPHNQAGAVAAVVELVEQIPSELLVLDTEAYAEFVAGLSAARYSLEAWPARGSGHVMQSVLGFRKLNPITLIRRALAKCPDEAPPAGETPLEFVGDLELRRALTIDLGAVRRALSNAEWKAATVLAGSLVEALLLWQLQNLDEIQVRAAKEKALEGGLPSSAVENGLTKWSLAGYASVAHSLGVISSETLAQVRIAKDFRNFIHPGREIRFGRRCDRGTALSAAAAVEHVMKDLNANTR